MKLLKSTFMSVFVVVITGIIITFLLLIFRIFALGFVGIGILCILFPILGRLSSEEWAIYILKRNGGSISYHNKRIFFSRKAMCRFEKRGVVTIEHGIISLVDPDYPCIFDEPDE